MRRRIKRLFRERHKQELLLIGLAVGFFLAGAIFLWIGTLKLPDLSSFETRKTSQSTKIYDRTGEILLYDIHNNAQRTVVPYADISLYVKNATVAIEDEEFYQHRGIKVTSILRAVFANLLTGSYGQGGSTITQQVVKNSLLTTEKTISRKIKEWVLALKLERVLSKDDILGIYLNDSPYGGSIYGIEEASQTFFGKSAAEVDLAQAAYLASLPNAPTYYSPYGNNRNKLEERKNLVLARMLTNKFITQAEYNDAKAQRVEFNPQATLGIRAPHFVIYVKQYLEQKYGEEMVENGGLKVITTLDYNLQEKAEAAAKKYAAYNTENFNAENAALVAIDPKTGGILSMVGSRDYFDEAIDGNFNVAIAHRQPGSAFKPLVYAEAFIKGYQPETVVFDTETEFSTSCKPDGTPIIAGEEDKCYRPGNYDEKFRGPVNLRSALAQSINIPAIKVLYLSGLADSLRLAQDMGIKSLNDPDRYGLTLVLGGGEVSPLDLTSAYSVFATGGIRNESRAILRVENSAGKVLEELTPTSQRVLPENPALQISDILSDEAARVPLYGNHSALYFDNAQVAVKTGTTNDYRDAWTIGYTPEVVLGAWVGNNDNRPMEKKISGLLVAPLWHEVMAEAIKLYPPTSFKKPELTVNQTAPPVIRGLWQGGISYFIDKLSGNLATEYTPPDLKEERVVRQIHSILYWVDKDNPTAPRTTPPETDSQFANWEWSVRNWAQTNNLTDQDTSIIPKTVDSLHTPANTPNLRITSPQPGAEFKPSDRVYVSFSSSGRFPVVKADFYINGSYAGSANRAPFVFVFSPIDTPDLQPTNSLKVVIFDSVSNRAETATDFKVADI